MTGSELNFTTFESIDTKRTIEAKKWTSKEFRSHPEFALNPHNSPCEDCTEQIEKRTLNSRYFVKNGSNGSEYFHQKSYGNLHYQDNDGWLRTVDPRLFPSEIPGRYEAPFQQCPVFIYVNDENVLCF